MSKCVTMYGENKPSTLINDTRCELNFFREIPVRSAMPNNIYVIISYHTYYVHRTNTASLIMNIYTVINAGVKISWIGLHSGGAAKAKKQGLAGAATGKSRSNPGE